TLKAAGSESPPDGYTYGVEYTKSDIDTALKSGNPASVVRTRDHAGSGHGTHVAGIAAGNGRPDGTFVGVAPEADIVMVASKGSNSDEGIGGSVEAFDAISYIFAVGRELGRPVVINMSLGDNLSAHDGTSSLE